MRRLSVGRRSTCLMLAALAVVAACGTADPIVVAPPAPPPTFTLSATTAWAGSTVTIKSAALASGGDSAVLQVANATLALTRLTDSTMSFVLRSDTGGSFTPELHLNGGRYAVPTITVNGFLEARAWSELSLGAKYAWPQGGNAIVMSTVFSNASFGLGFFDLDQKTVTKYDSIMTWGSMLAPGLTPQDSVFLLRGYDGGLNRWKLGATPVLIETGVAIPNQYHVVAILSSNVTVRGGSHNTLVATATPPATTTFRSEDAGMMYASPNRNRWIESASVGPATGLPVLDSTGQTAYSIPLQAVTTADFSADNQWLAVGGGPPTGSLNPSPGRLVVLNAASGEVVRDTTLVRSVFGARFDPYRPLLYLGTVAANGRPTILVFERTNWSLVATLTVPDATFDCGGCYAAILVVSKTGGLYVATDANGQQTRTYRFQLPPNQ